MTGIDDEDIPNEFESDKAKLEQTLVEAHYLGLSLRALAANPSFRYAAVTASVCDLLIGWARFVGDRLQRGERPFVGNTAGRGGGSGRKR